MAEEQLDIAQGEGSIPRVRLGEIGSIGLKQSSGNIYEDVKNELRWPNSVKTFKLMSYDAVISSALQTVEMMISGARWEVVPPKDATEEELKKCDFIRQCMGDMEHSWLSFIKEIPSNRIYGFCINEKVYRKRLKRLGSKYNDGLIGWKKLPVRSQDTITKFNYSEDGRDLISITQDLSLIDNGMITSRFKGEVDIPRNKVMIFTVDGKRGNPIGTSPLSKVWNAWKYRTSLQELEAISVCRDMAGTAKFGVPANILDPNASDEEKAALEEVKKIGRNWNKNEQSFILMPNAYDENNNKLYDLEIMGVTGGKTYDVSSIIKRYDNNILTALFGDMLVLSQNAQGSFALASAFEQRVEMAIRSYLCEIADVLNTDLIPQTFALNGWSDERLPMIEPGRFTKDSLEEFSKAIQRLSSVGMLAKTARNVNHIADVVGLPERVDENLSVQELKEYLSDDTSRAGDGMATPFEGTRTSDGGQNDNDNNSENTA